MFWGGPFECPSAGRVGLLFAIFILIIAAAMAQEMRQRLSDFFLDEPEDDRDPMSALWIEGDSLAPFIVTPMRNCMRAFECVTCFC